MLQKPDESRAREVYNYLIANGVAKERISFTGYGTSRRLVAPEKDKADQYTTGGLSF